MNLQQYVDTVQQQLLVAAEAGGNEATALAARLAAPLDAVVRLTVQEALAAAAEEITLELAPGSVEVRLRGREPEFVVTPAPAPGPAESAGPPAPADLPPASPGGDEGGTARINLRLPEQLKAKVEAAASRDGLSVNTFLVRAAAAAVDPSAPATRPAARRAPTGSQRFTGWVR
jgi:HicB family